MKSATLVAGILSALMAVAAAYLIEKGSEPFPWDKRSWTSETDDEKGHSRKTARFSWWSWIATAATAASAVTTAILGSCRRELTVPERLFERMDAGTQLKSRKERPIPRNPSWPAVHLDVADARCPGKGQGASPSASPRPAGTVMAETAGPNQA